MSQSYRLTRRQTIAALAGFGLAGGLPEQADAQARDPNERPTQATAVDRGSVKWLMLPPTPMLPAATRTGIAAVNGTNVFYAQFGDGPPVLLLHGGLANSNYWGHQVVYLAQKFSVTVMDTRGHGRSPFVPRTFSYGLFAEDASGLLDFLKIPQAAIVGWSDGAITGLELAMQRPEKVVKLFAFGANISADGLKPGGARSPIFTAYAGRCHAEYAKLSPHPERWPQLLDHLRRMWRTEPSFGTRELAAVRAPTTISDGAYDEIIKGDHTAKIARMIAGAKLRMLPGVSHFAMLQDPDQFNRALTEFLAA